jgi:hypothetical protein
MATSFSDSRHLVVRLWRCASFLLATLVIGATAVPAAADDVAATANPEPTIASKTAKSLHPFCKAGKWGYVDNQGVTVIEPRFDYADWFIEGLAGARQADVAGYLRPDGTWKFELPKHISPTRSFSDGRVAFRDGDKFGFLDREGNVVVPATYDHVTDFREGRAGVLVENGGPVGNRDPPSGFWGFIDPDGKLVIPAAFGFSSEFSEGLALGMRARKRRPDNGWDIAPSDDRDFIDRDGKLVLTVNPDVGSPKAFVSHVKEFSEGLLAVSAAIPDKLAAKYVSGFVDKTGKIAIAFSFESAHAFSEGLAGAKKFGKWGFINRQGAWTICPVFDEVGYFREGYARVRIEKQWHFVDRRGCTIPSANRDLNGQFIATSRWNDARDFCCGTALVHVGGELDCNLFHEPCRWTKGTWYYLNRTGTVVSVAWRDDDEPSAWRPAH